MLVVNVELWPHGNRTASKSIAKMAIANIQKSVSINPNHYDYVWVYNEPNPIQGNPVDETGVIRCYNRYAPVHELVENVLRQVSGEIQPEIMSEYEFAISKKMNEEISK
jgi:hypothetical protein